MVIANENENTYCKPVFCALFNIDNQHIMKEDGLLSWGMYKYHGYNSFLATYENGSYPNLKYLPGLRMEFIPKVTGRWFIDSYLWLIKNARRIDTLFVFHMRVTTFAQVFTYKLLNPKGKVYLKFDGAPLPENGGKLKRPFYKWLVNNSDCVSTELEYNAKLLSREWGRKIICIPNPANPEEFVENRPFSQRNNVILTVGRLGTQPKATEILLEAFARIHAKIPNWTLKLVGKIEENTNIASDFHTKYPELKSRVVFVGEIRDRAELMGVYRDAKIFAFPSRHESFGIALTEAMMQGNFAVVSRIPTNEYLTDNYKFALSSDVDDIDGLARSLMYACTHEDEIERLALKGMNVTRERLDLKRCSDLTFYEIYGGV